MFPTVNQLTQGNLGCTIYKLYSSCHREVAGHWHNINKLAKRQKNLPNKYNRMFRTFWDFSSRFALFLFSVDFSQR